MNVSYYPGCSLDGTAREYGESAEAVAQLLGIELQELDDWTCCGASSAHVTNNELAVALPARNLLIADRVGVDLVVPCSACFQRFKVAEKELLAGKGILGSPDGLLNFQGYIVQGVTAIVGALIGAGIALMIFLLAIMKA